MVLIGACKKEWPYTMKTGYYAVQDIRIYTNGSIDTFYYTAVGPGVNDASVGFASEKDGAYVPHGFELGGNESSSIHGDGGPNGRWFFKIVDLEWSETHLYCYRVSTYSDTITGVFDNYITFTYVE